MIKSINHSNKIYHNNYSVKSKENGWIHQSKLKQEAPAVGAVSPKRVKSEKVPESNKFGNATDIRIGICKIFGVRCTLPIFLLDFSAVPSCFVYMHLRLLLSVKCLSAVTTLLDEDSSDEVTSECEEPSVADVVLHPSVRASKLAGLHSQYRNGLNSCGVQKRRSSLRRKKARNPYLVAVHKANGALVSDLISSGKSGIPFSFIVYKNKLRSSAPSSPACNFKVASPSVVEETQAMDTSTCSSNVLVVESDRCYRIEGATITLEVSDSKEWLVVIKKDGLTRFTYLAQKGMRPCTYNCITHDIIWTGDEGWKLEFPYREDWLIFKDIYKECSNRNVLMPAPAFKAIPVPGVHEVLGYEDSNHTSFCRPNAYISVSNDDVARALAKRCAIYDMDSEDEEWLRKFFVGTEHEGHLSEDNFELMIDAFEKALYGSTDDFADEKAAVYLCIELGRRVVFEALYAYWMKKRKQRRSALLRVFQGHQAKKAPLIPKPVLRKRRSFKRQAIQFGRGKQPILLQGMNLLTAMCHWPLPSSQRDVLIECVMTMLISTRTTLYLSNVGFLSLITGGALCLFYTIGAIDGTPEGYTAMAAEHDAEEQNAMLKVEAAKEEAKRSAEVAILKRLHAQKLLGNADLAIYRATMTLRIVEASLAQSADSTDDAVTHFLD